MIRVIITMISISLLPLFASEPTIQDGRSPNGVFGLRQTAQGPVDAPTSLEFFNVKSQKAITFFRFGGYAAYAMAADPMNLKCLWSPDSKHFALMQRTTKTTWQTSVYSVSDSTCSRMDTPDFTKFVLTSLDQKNVFRFLRETPVKWTADDRLEVEVAGDYGSAQQVLQYAGTAVFDLTSGKVTLPTPAKTKPEEG